MRNIGQCTIDRALSKQGIASRSQTVKWVAEGRLKVNGRTVTGIDMVVTLGKDRFSLDGKPLVAAAAQTIMLNKPKGYVTTASDEKGRKTVYDLLPQGLRHLHPVGRLDMNTTGLLLMTTDTKLSAFLTDPANGIERIYVVTVEGKVSDDTVNALLSGIKDEGELLKADKLAARKVSNRESHLTVTLTEGKNREVRRMFKSVGHEVTSLKRIAFGEYKLGDLALGQHKIVH